MAKNDFQSQVLRRLIAIDNKTNSIEDNSVWLVRANASQLKNDFVKAFGKSKRRVQVYLALDGTRNVNDIAAHLGMKGQNVTGELRWLINNHLIDIVDASGEGIIYNKKLFDTIAGLSRALTDKFNLDESGKKQK